MHLILKLTSSLVFLLLIACTPVLAQDNKTESVPDTQQKQSTVGVFYNSCMTKSIFEKAIKKYGEYPIFQSPSQSHGPAALLRIYVNDITKTFTIAVQNVTLPDNNPTKVCILSNGKGFENLMPEAGIKI